MKTRLLLALALLVPATAAAQSPREEAFRTFLQASFAEARAEWPDASYTAAFADLNGDGRDEALVSLQAGLFCGSGGCALYIYTPDGASWRQVSELTIVGAPVRLLPTRTRGWRDLAVSTRGGGMDLPRLTRVRFDGAGYATHAPLARRIRGRLLLDNETPSRSLYR